MRGRPWFDKLTMRFKPLKKLGLILSLSKDEATFLAPHRRLKFLQPN